MYQEICSPDDLFSQEVARHLITFEKNQSGLAKQDLEDFIVSNNLLPFGSLCYVLFCTSKYGWGFKNFLKEANCGEGISFPKQVGFYVSYIIPVIILVIFIQGYISKFL